MDFGAQLFTFRKSLGSLEDLKGVFRMLREESGGSVQLSGLRFRFDAAEFGALARDYGIKVPITHTPWQRICEDTGNVIKEHKALGAEVVGLGMMPRTYKNPEGLRKFAAEVNGVQKLLAGEGLGFAYHNHAYEFKKTGGERVIDFLARECPDMSFIFDTYWCYYAGFDPAKEITRLSGKVRNIHLKDGAKLFKLPLITDVGKGKLDFRTILLAAEAAGTEHAYIEHDFTSDPYRTTRESLRYLHEIYPE